MISIPICYTNTTECLSCPLQLLQRLLTCISRPSSIILFCVSYNNDENRVYSTQWNTMVFEQYITNVNTGHVLLTDFCSALTKISKSGTHGITFIPVRLANLRPNSKTWLTVGIDPMPTSITSILPDENRRELKFQLLHRFIFLMFKFMLEASYSGLMEPVYIHPSPVHDHCRPVRAVEAIVTQMSQ